MSDMTNTDGAIGSNVGGRKRTGLKRAALAAGAIVGLAVATQYGLEYWRTGRFLVDTDDAYVEADSSTIAPRVSGYIDRVLVEDNQQVKAGTVLATIDDRDL
jgi:membrane fusion protein (multidrug efflux system)